MKFRACEDFRRRDLSRLPFLIELTTRCQKLTLAEAFLLSVEAAS